MERRSGAVNDAASTVANNKGHQDGVDPKMTKKKRRPMHILRVATYMLSLKSGKSKTVHTDCVSKWKQFLSSMRPLHINSNQSTQRCIEDTIPAASLKFKEVVEQLKVYTPSAASEDVVEQLEVFTPPWSPAPKSVGSSSSGQTSQYASAQNLQELDDQSDEDEEDSYYDDKFGDEMIDMKAEEFIAKFYDQMKLQNKRRQRSLS